MNYARAALLPLVIRCLLRLSFLVVPRTPPPSAKREIKTKRSVQNKPKKQQMRSLLQVHSRSSPASPMDQSPRLRAPHMCGSHLLQAQRLAWGFTGFRARSSSSPRLPRVESTCRDDPTTVVRQRILTYGPVAAAPSSTHVRKSSPLSAASGVGVRGLPGLLFVESTAPKA